MAGEDGDDGAGPKAPKVARPKRKAAGTVAPQGAGAGRAEDAGAKDGDEPPATEPAGAGDGSAPAADSLAPVVPGDAPAAAGKNGEQADAAEAREKGEGGDAEKPPEKKGGAMSRLLKRNKAAPAASKDGYGGVDPGATASDKPRHWELILNARAFTYVGADKHIDTFFAVSVRPEHEKVRNRVQLLTEYTPAYILQRNERFSLPDPITLYDRKKFMLSYHQLQKYVLQVDMWRVSPWTFNQFYGQQRVRLWDIAKKNPNMSVKLHEKLTKKDEAEKKKMKRPISDVAVFECTVNLEEIFDFHLLLANWRFDYEPHHPDTEARLQEKLCLSFIIPKNCYSDPLKKKGCRVSRTLWRGGGKQVKDSEENESKETQYRWQRIGKAPFIFRGTRTSLTNQFFIVMCHSGRPVGGAPMSSIGSALMGLTSILTISVFKGKVKALTTEEKYFIVGTLTGSMQALMCCINEHFVEEIPGGRPEQPMSNLNVTSLPKMRYLVVRVTKCEGLAVADSESFSSDPFLVVVWDNMVQKSNVIEKTCAPVFNYTFYFPFRPFTNKLETRRYQETALPLEMKAKNSIVIQVWDDDGSTSADSLGFVRLNVKSLMANNHKLVRNLKGKVKSVVQDEDDENTQRHDQWYDREEEVRVYDGSKTELTGCTLPNSQTALIYFEAYFFPDFPDEVAARATQVLSNYSELNASDLWRQREKALDRESADFARAYAEPFPDSIGAKPCKEEYLTVKNLRRFQCCALHPQNLELIPLMAYLVKITTDDAYASPMMLLHWMNCITYCNPPSQERSGLIPPGGWKDPQYMLFTRKGPVQDHALLLCSVLLGSGWEAYVCKGTVWTRDMKLKRLKDAAAAGDDKKPEKPTHFKLDEPLKLVEHTWVMTRENGGWVTFWEPTTLEMYHMPLRWTPIKKKKKKAETAGDAEDEDSDEEAQGALINPEDELTYLVDDMAVRGEDVDNLPVVGSVRRIPKAKEKSKMGARERLRQEQIAQRERLPTAPKSKLLDVDEKTGTLVDWLPYDSIDVVFNMDNLWCNRQNHHPACIMYDFEPIDDVNPCGWSKLLKDDEERKNLPFDYINADVLVDPALKPEKLTGLELETINEMEENMRLYRQKKGNDTWWDKGPELLAQLTNFLDVQERMKTIDVDLCPIWKKSKEDWSIYERYLVERLNFGRCRRPWNRYGTPFTQPDGEGARKYRNYRATQKQAWEELMDVVTKFVDRKKLFPTKKGKVFNGFPVHFCTVDKNEIRRYLMQLPQYRKLLERPEENLEFTVHCKIYGFLGGIQSCWLYFGVQSLQEEEKGPQ